MKCHAKTVIVLSIHVTDYQMLMFSEDSVKKNQLYSTAVISCAFFYGYSLYLLNLNIFCKDSLNANFYLFQTFSTYSVCNKTLQQVSLSCERKKTLNQVVFQFIRRLMLSVHSCRLENSLLLPQIQKICYCVS